MELQICGSRVMLAANLTSTATMKEDPGVIMVILMNASDGSSEQKVSSTNASKSMAAAQSTKHVSMSAAENAVQSPGPALTLPGAKIAEAMITATAK